MVIYSAGINETALDRLSPRDTDPNGLFTREFLKYLRQPGLRVDDMLKQVRGAGLTAPCRARRPARRRRRASSRRCCRSPSG